MTTAAFTASFGRARAVTGWQARSYRRTWHATVTTAFLNPIFFLLSIGVLLGGLVDERTAGLGGLSYLEFVAPALLAAMAMQVGVIEGMYPVMAGIKWLRTFHAVVATPVHVGELFLGVLGWAALRILAAAIVFAAVAGAAGALGSPLAVFVPAAALLCGLAFFAPLAGFAAAREDDWAFPALNRFVIIPMFLFSGTFFPVSQLPAWLEPVAWATPLWHGSTLCRDLATGTVPLLPSLAHVAYLLAFALVGMVVAVRVFARKLHA